MNTSAISSLAIKCKDGIVFAANPIARKYGVLISEEVDRFYQTGNNMVMVGSGDHSDFQKLNEKVQERWYRQSVYSNVEKPDVEYYSHFLANECYRMRNKVDPYLIDAALGGFDSEGNLKLYYIDQFGTVFERNYVSTGFSNYMNQPILGIISFFNFLFYFLRLSHFINKKILF